MIEVLPWSDRAGWDSFVSQALDGTIMHLSGWKAVLERAYGLRAFLLAAYDGDELRGVLPLALVRSPLFGRSLVSMPFVDYGGVCASGNDKAEQALVEAARDLAAAQRATLVLRYLRRPELPLPSSLEKVTMLLELGESEEALWRRLPAERRNRIRKAQKYGLVASVHGAEALEAFYTVFAANMRDLGSPVHSKRFFREVLAEFTDRTRILLVSCQGRPVGAGLLLLFNGMISIPWVSSLRQFLDRCPNQLLYWEAMRFGLARGYRLLDFGRSSKGAGTWEAKRQWGAREVQLYWLSWPEAVAPSDMTQRFSWVVPFWQRLPIPVTTLVGPWLRRGIPN